MYSRPLCVRRRAMTTMGAMRVLRVRPIQRSVFSVKASCLGVQKMAAAAAAALEKLPSATQWGAFPREVLESES